MKTEIAIYYTSLASFFVLTFFYPLLYLNTTAYYLSLYFFFLNVKLLNYLSITFIVPITLLAFSFAIISGIVLLIKWKYSAFLSLFYMSLSASLFLATYIYITRYFYYKGYLLYPTPTGVFYLGLPIAPKLNFPFYLVFLLLGLSVLNAYTDLSWLTVRPMTELEKLLRADEGRLIILLSSTLKKLGITHEVKGSNKLMIGNNFVIEEAERPDFSVFFPTHDFIVIGRRVSVARINGEISFLDRKNAIKITLSESLRKGEII